MNNKITTADLVIMQGKTFNKSVLCSSTEITYNRFSSVIENLPLTLGLDNSHQIKNKYPVRLFFDDGQIFNYLNINCNDVVVAERVNDNTLIFKTVVLKDDYLRFCRNKRVNITGAIAYYEPFDLTDFNARMQIRPSVGSETILYEVTDISIDIDNSSIDIVIPATDTQLFQFTSAVYDLEAYNSSGEVISIIGPSNISVIREVTK